MGFYIRSAYASTNGSKSRACLKKGDRTAKGKSDYSELVTIVFFISKLLNKKEGTYYCGCLYRDR